MNNPLKPRKPRKRSLRGKFVGEERRDGTAASLGLKKKWAEDTEWAEKQRKRLRERTRIGRTGVPDGMRKWAAKFRWDIARERARKFITIMEDAGKLDKVVVPGSEAEMAKKTLEEAFVHAIGPMTDAKSRASYMRLVLEFTKAKPESKSKLTLDKSEEWLAALSADMKANGNNG